MAIYSFKIGKVVSKFGQTLNKASKVCLIFLKICPSGEILPNLVALLRISLAKLDAAFLTEAIPGLFSPIFCIFDTIYDQCYSTQNKRWLESIRGYSVGVSSNRFANCATTTALDIDILGNYLVWNMTWGESSALATWTALRDKKRSCCINELY